MISSALNAIVFHWTQCVTVGGVSSGTGLASSAVLQETGGCDGEHYKENLCFIAGELDLLYKLQSLRFGKPFAFATFITILMVLAVKEHLWGHYLGALILFWPLLSFLTTLFTVFVFLIVVPTSYTLAGHAKSLHRRWWHLDAFWYSVHSSTCLQEITKSDFIAQSCSYMYIL